MREIYPNLWPLYHWRTTLIAGPCSKRYNFQESGLWSVPKPWLLLTIFNRSWQYNQIYWIHWDLPTPDTPYLPLSGHVVSTGDDSFVMCSCKGLRLNSGRIGKLGHGLTSVLCILTHSRTYGVFSSSEMQVVWAKSRDTAAAAVVTEQWAHSHLNHRVVK